MRCPWCGSPVMVRGNWWECGYCGDSGAMPQPAAEQEVTLSVSLVCRVDLTETWNDLNTALQRLAPEHAAALKSLLGKTLLYEISDGVQQGNPPHNTQKMHELEAFLRDTSDLCPEKTADTLMQEIKLGMVYASEAELSTQICGTFWSTLISVLQPRQFYTGEAEGLSDLLYGLSSAYAYFCDNSGNEWEITQERQDTLEDAFYLNWQEKLLLHPDGMRAKQLLAQGEFPQNEDICRDILVTEFPEEIAGYTVEDLSYLSWDELIENVFERDVPKGIRMWRTLLDLADESLKVSRTTAKKLLPDWDVLDASDPDAAEPFLSALEEDVFAGQMFQSAFAGSLQRDLLRICHACKKFDLEQRCRDLLRTNPACEWI